MKLLAIITCPTCETKTDAEIPEGVCLISWDCPACQTTLRPKSGGLLRVLLLREPPLSDRTADLIELSTTLG